MKVPNPTECPDCRFMCRAIWRNETTLYSRMCDMCQKGIISMYNPKSPYTVYCNDCYRSDAWDAKDFAQDYDMSKSFFEQLDELLKKIPKASLYVTTIGGPNINSPFNNGFGGAKNCYFLFNGGPAEETLYSRGTKDVKNISDCYFSTKLEDSYESINSHNSSKLFYCQNVTNSIETYFSINSSNLINCFGCANLRNKSYCWFNEQLTREDYESRFAKIVGSYSELQRSKKEFENFVLQFPHRESQNIKTVDCVGNYLTECKNVKQSFEVTKSEDCKYIFASKVIKDSLGTIGYGTNSEQLLEVVATGYSSTVIGTYWAENSQRVMYSFEPRNSQDIIGCDSLKNAQYCILNKQYTKEEYEVLRAHIVGELTRNGDYGLMLPPELSLFGYNETIGNDNMKLTKERAMELGFTWQDDIQKTVGKETIQPEAIPDNITDIVDTITDEILRCVDCTCNYKITEQELFFYRKMKLPIPRKCFFCRHHDRIEKRGPYKFWKRNCALCNKDIETNFAPDRPEIVYCEECYRREVL